MLYTLRKSNHSFSGGQIMMEKALKLGVPVFTFLALVWLMMGAPPQKVGYAPEQPIHYSHVIHATTYNMDCQYCHTGVETSKKAGVPSINICMNCHSLIYKKGEAEKVQKAWKDQKSPEWIRVHNVPDHVHFSHAPHIKALSKAGEPTKESCKKCHGDVASMEVVAQQETLNMGFCIDCHREYEAEGARTNCSTCHY